MKNMKLMTAALLISVVLSSCTKPSAPNPEPSTPIPSNKETPVSAPETAAEKRLKEMSLKEKIGQLFVIRPDALDPSLSVKQINDSSRYGVTKLSPEMIQQLKEYPSGGIIMFGKNIIDPDQLIKMNADLQEASSLPLLIGIDEEGGSVSRIANSKNFTVPKFSSMQDIGKTKDPEKAYEVGMTIGTYLKNYGFNLDFAPDSDVNTNPDNIVIGNRSFGSDPSETGEMVSAAVRGFHDAGIISSVKHFPGHGDTRGDTHDGFVSITKTWNELKQCELIPFKKAMEVSVDMIMISHITTPNITSDSLPSSLSEEMISQRLKQELGYKGIIITDSMSMGAITKQYSAEEAAVTAILAGVDIILMPENYTEAFNGISVQEGSVSEERINESVLKILALKEQYQLLN